MKRAEKKPPTVGVAELRYSGFTGSVDYEVAGDLAALKRQSSRLRGFFVAPVEVAAGAFRAGEGQLRMESGAGYRITLLGYTAGADRAYFEIYA